MTFHFKLSLCYTFFHSLVTAWRHKSGGGGSKWDQHPHIVIATLSPISITSFRYIPPFVEVSVPNLENKGSCACVLRGRCCPFLLDFGLFRQCGIFVFILLWDFLSDFYIWPKSDCFSDVKLSTPKVILILFWKVWRFNRRKSDWYAKNSCLEWFPRYQEITTEQCSSYLFSFSVRI